MSGKVSYPNNTQIISSFLKEMKFQHFWIMKFLWKGNSDSATLKLPKKLIIKINIWENVRFHQFTTEPIPTKGTKQSRRYLHQDNMKQILLAVLIGGIIAMAYSTPSPSKLKKSAKPIASFDAGRWRSQWTERWPRSCQASQWIVTF